MNKSKIEWCDMTWNPVTGCLHGCEYCYARGIVKRFEARSDGYTSSPDSPCGGGENRIIDLQMPMRGKDYRVLHYPYGFSPTFHRYRLDEPQRIKTPQNVFVCSMADLFGEWIPYEWIEEVFTATILAEQHRYIFLTKNPAGIDRAIEYYAGEERYMNVCFEFFQNMWFGASIATQDDICRVATLSQIDVGHRFLSVEPLHGSIKLEFPKEYYRCPLCGSYDIYHDNPRTANGMPPFYCDCCGEYESKDGADLKPPIEWVIIGAETGNRKGKVIPERKWIENIVTACREADTPVFMKNSLADIWGEPLIQEYPWEVER